MRYATAISHVEINELSIAFGFVMYPLLALDVITKAGQQLVPLKTLP